MFSLWKFSHRHCYTLPIHIWESRTQCSTHFDMENVSSSSTFPGNLLSHWAEATLTKTIGRVWWSWQSRWGVIRTVLTHYFKQTERAPMRGIMERDDIWQGSPGCSPKEATIFCRRNHPAGMKPPNNTEASTQQNIRQYLIFEIQVHIFSKHAAQAWKPLQAHAWCSSHPVIKMDWPTGTRDTPDWYWNHPWCSHVQFCNRACTNQPQQQWVRESTDVASWDPDELRKPLDQPAGSLNMVTW